MPRLPDVRIEDWLTDQQKRFSEATAGLWDATEFELGARQAESTIPPDYDAVGGMDQWEQAEQDLLEKQYRAQQQADEERQRQEVEAQAEQYRQQQQQAEAQAALAQQAEQTQQQQQESSMMDMIRSMGIPTPSDAFESFKTPGDPTSSSGIFDVGAPSQPPQSDADAFNQFAGGMVTDAFGAPTPDPLANQSPQPDHSSSSGLLDQIGSAVQSGASALGSAASQAWETSAPRVYRPGTEEYQRFEEDAEKARNRTSLLEGPPEAMIQTARGMQAANDLLMGGGLGLAGRTISNVVGEPTIGEYVPGTKNIPIVGEDLASSTATELAMPMLPLPGKAGRIVDALGGAIKPGAEVVEAVTSKIAPDLVSSIQRLIQSGMGDDMIVPLEQKLANDSDVALSAVQRLTRATPETAPRVPEEAVNPWEPTAAERAEVARQDAEIAGRPAHAGYLAEDVADAERATSATPSEVAAEHRVFSPESRGLTADEARQMGIPGFEDVPAREVRPRENVRGYGNVLPDTSPEGAQFIRENVGESTPLTRAQADQWAAELLNTNPERIAELRRNAPDSTQAGVEQRALRMASQNPIEELVAARQELQRLKRIAREAEGAVPEAVQIDMAHAVNEFAIKELAARDAIHGPTAYSRAASKVMNAQKGAYEGVRAAEEAQRLETVGKAFTKAAKSAQKAARTGIVDEGVLKDLGDAAGVVQSKRTREALARETPKTPKPKTDKPPLTPAQVEAQEQRRVAGIANKEKSKQKREEIQKMAADARMWAKRMQKMPKYADQMRPHFEDVLVKLDEHSQAGNKVAGDIRQRLTARMQEDVYEGAFKAHRATEDAHIQSVVDRIREIQNNARGPEVHLEVSKLFKELEEIGIAGKEKASSLRQQANARGILKAGLKMEGESYEAVVKLLEDVDPADPNTLKPILALMQQPGLLDVINEISYINLLSNPYTNLKNIGSTGSQLMLKTLLRNPAEFVGSLGQTKGQMAALKGATFSIPEGARLAGTTMKTGINPRRLEEAVTKGEYQHINREHLPAIMAEQGLPGIIPLDAAKRLGGKMGEALHWQSTRPLAAADAMLGHMAYQSAIWEKAQQRADDILRKGGDELDDLGAIIRRTSDEKPRMQIANHIINNIWDYPDIIKEAGKLEDYTLFRTNRGKKTGLDLKMSNALRTVSAFKTVSPNAGTGEKLGALFVNMLLPFQDVPYNYTKQGLRNVAEGVASPVTGPAALLKSAGGVVRGGQAGADARQIGGERFARAAQGAALLAIPLMLANNEKDSLTGPGPRDPGKRRMWLENHKPNSYRLPYTDTWISYEGMPWGIPFAMVAGMKEALDEAKDEPDQSNTAKVISGGVGLGKGAVRGIASQSLIEPFMRNFEIVSGESGENNLAQTLAAVASRYSPHDLVVPAGSGMLGFLAGLADTVERDTGRARNYDEVPEVARNVLDSRLPGLRNELPERRDAYGNVMEKSRWRGLLGYEGEPPMPNDPITEHLEKAGVGIPTAPEAITYSGGKIPLTIREQSRFQQYYGEEMRAYMEVYNVGHEPYTPDELITYRGRARKMAQDRILQELGSDEVKRRWREEPDELVEP